MSVIVGLAIENTFRALKQPGIRQKEKRESQKVSDPKNRIFLVFIFLLIEFRDRSDWVPVSLAKFFIVYSLMALHGTIKDARISFSFRWINTSIELKTRFNGKTIIFHDELLPGICYVFVEDV